MYIINILFTARVQIIFFLFAAPKPPFMQKKLATLLVALLTVTLLQAKDPEDSLQNAMDQQLKFIDSVQTALKWQTNTIALPNGIARLKLPAEFKFLNAAQSQFILHDVWGNPPRTDVLGMIFPVDGDPYSDSSFAFIVSYEAEGYVKDNDADKINYDDMLKQIKESEPESNKQRAASGYGAIHMIGWAQKPYYDKTNKVLHWAKELQFGNDGSSTLNYDVRVLGRKGILSLNAIANMSELSLVKANIDKVLKIPEFTEGNRYADFDESTDKVAEYGIGALVAGGILAKTGFFGLVGKFLLAAWKFILIGIVALWGTIRKFFGGKKKEKEDDYHDRVSMYKPEENNSSSQAN
jgi:uncharacterized membrane-anchored protein